MFASAGFYNNTKKLGFDFEPKIKLNGTLWDTISMRFDMFGLVTKAPLTLLGEYDIGYYWDDDNYQPEPPRTIKTFANYAFFPFAYQKRWDGSVYFVDNLSPNGLEGWPMSLAVGFGIFSEVDMAFFNNNLTLRLGRQYREWAGMENGSSLVLNAAARPFVGLEMTATLFPWFSFSSITGSLEMPNSEYMTENAYKDKTEDAYQNCFSINMLELNFKYTHIDFGTTSVWPKRFELGYIYPLMSKLFFQNNIGNFDNLGLFGNLKMQYPGLGSMWFSLFLDEASGLSKQTGLLSGNFLSSTRNMYAYQAGINSAIPLLPFTTVSLRYTKVEPYCYTHQVIGDTPWYTGYISESYTNNGTSLGYYLPPNADELLLRFETMPVTHLSAHAQYQFIRHGADYGSRSVRGSSIYSEMDNADRNSLRKYFLQDGAYQWFHIIKFGGEYNVKDLIGLPITVYGDIGYVYSYFTDSDTGTGEAQYQKGDYHRIDTDEYPTMSGFIISLGARIFY